MGHKRMNITTSFYGIAFIVGLFVVLGYFILYTVLSKFGKTNYTDSRHESYGYGYRDLNDSEKYV